MSTPRHCISNVNPENKSGTCSVCGTVEVYLRKKQGNWMCRNKLTESFISRRGQQRAIIASGVPRKAAWNRSGGETSNRQKIADIKLLRGCADCGYNEHPAALDFDHRPEETKLFTISYQSRSMSWKRLEAEIAKCDVVCSNCHRIRTYNRLAENRAADSVLVLSFGA